MREIALLISIAGMLVLGLLMLNLKTVEVRDVDDLKRLKVNTKVFVEGKVVDERVLYLGSKLIVLNNGIEVICECSESFKEKRVRVEGLIDEFNNKKQLAALKVEVFG